MAFSTIIELIIKAARESWQDHNSISERNQIIHIISQNSHSFSKKRPDSLKDPTPLKEVIIWVYYIEETMFHSGDNIDLG